MGRRLTPDGREKEEKINLSDAFVRKHNTLLITSCVLLLPIKGTIAYLGLLVIMKGKGICSPLV
jgi:hypothetical protein